MCGRGCEQSVKIFTPFQRHQAQRNDAEAGQHDRTWLWHDGRGRQVNKERLGIPVVDAVTEYVLTISRDVRRLAKF